MELLENGDRTRDRLDDDPRILPQLSFGDLDTVEVGGALPFPAGELPQSGARMTTDAAAFEGQHYWWRGDIPTVHYSPGFLGL